MIQFSDLQWWAESSGLGSSRSHLEALILLSTNYLGSWVQYELHTIASPGETIWTGLAFVRRTGLREGENYNSRFRERNLGQSTARYGEGLLDRLNLSRVNCA